MLTSIRHLKISKICRFAILAALVVGLPFLCHAVPSVVDIQRLLNADGPAEMQLTVTGVTAPANAQPGELRVTFTYQCLDARDNKIVGRGKMYFTQATTRTDQRPLYYSAGYECPEASALLHMRRGYVVVSTTALPGGNPLSRTPRFDIALLHRARALAFVDDAHMMVGGGSAGVYMALMLASETFPLKATFADSPPLNWGYNAAYFFKQKEMMRNFDENGKPKAPYFSVVVPMLASAMELFGNDFDEKTWFALSPVGNLDGITAPVSVHWSTADLLVPIDQISKEFVRPLKKGVFPNGFTMDMGTLMKSEHGKTRLLDKLEPEQFEVTLQKFPAGAVRLDKGPKPKDIKRINAPVATKQWSIMVIDEGEPEPADGHSKYFFAVSREKYLRMAVKRPLGMEQLTEAKLKRLIQRFRGIENQESKIKQLDFSEVEKTDVIRGLTTYVRQGKAHRKHFEKLYKYLPKEFQVLPPIVP